MSQKYRTAPHPTTMMPGGIPYIVGNEAAERFSFYGMKTILFVFMTQYLMGIGHTSRAVMSADEAKEYVHLFVAAAYFFPLLGAIVSDTLLGKYRTILILSIVYCFGHLALALDETRIGLVIGLTLIAIGAGGIKPCVSAHVGDQFGTQNQHLLSNVFAWFYFSINLGAFASTLLTPLLLAKVGPSVAFGVPGVLMFVATVVFWLGRHKFVHVPPGGIGSVKEAVGKDGLRAVFNLVPIYLCVMMFWALFDQTGSAWIQQARRMDRHWLSVDWLPSQIQAANPLLILAFIPLFAYVIYPAIERVFPLTPLRKVAIGFFVTVTAFALPAWIETQIQGGEVLASSSEGDQDVYPVERLFDGTADGGGWVSEAVGDWQAPQEIVVRLRQRKAWPINAARINPAADLTRFLRKHDGPSTPSADAIEACWAKHVEILVGDSPRGDAQRDERGNTLVDESGQPQFRWTRTVGEIELQRRREFQTLTFSTTAEAQYVMIRVKSNWGGAYVCLGEVEINAADPVPPTSDKHVAEIWPNVAATGYRPSIVWQLVAYVLMTAAEIMVSITCLEFSYTQAPRKMKSFIMGLFFLSVSLGNLLTSRVNGYIQNVDGSSKLEGASYYWFFTAAMLATAFSFLIIMRFYRGETYIQGDQSM